MVTIGTLLCLLLGVYLATAAPAAVKPVANAQQRVVAPGYYHHAEEQDTGDQAKVQQMLGPPGYYYYYHHAEEQDTGDQAKEQQILRPLGYYYYYHHAEEQDTGDQAKEQQILRPLGYYYYYHHAEEQNNSM